MKNIKMSVKDLEQSWVSRDRLVRMLWTGEQLSEGRGFVSQSEVLATG